MASQSSAAPQWSLCDMAASFSPGGTESWIFAQTGGRGFFVFCFFTKLQQCEIGKATSNRLNELASFFPSSASPSLPQIVPIYLHRFRVSPHEILSNYTGKSRNPAEAI